MPKTKKKKRQAKKKPEKKPQAKRAKKAADEAPAWVHLSKKRCPRCRELMKSDGTRDGGRLKRWRCDGRAPVGCGHRAATVGTPV